MFKQESNSSEYTPIENIASAESLESRLAATYGIDRSNYGDGAYGGKKFKIIEIFKQLPPIPEDFWRSKYLIMTGKANPEWLCNLSGDYYLQPEFYGNNFLETGLVRYQTPDPLHWTPEGYGTFPHEMETMTYPGTEVYGCTFFHSSWGVETYQGFSMNPVYPSSANVGGIKTPIDSELSRKYISVQVEPNAEVIGPAYILFSNDWSKKIKISIEVAEGTPAGVYAVGFDVARAPLNIAKTWVQMYGEKYQQKGFMSISEPQFIWVVQVL